ncbi:hypothetical protein H6P81_021334 [Aristolochia fimbriata]|uniref:Uncharacterized protein n=1 Tax=Aristolochia fimbriata TaxID=158543 RepID=A0AAV7DQ93_ARIFI|nr:hypothetical protein H6P81_021334 [Aristolochia fimbriata]
MSDSLVRVFKAGRMGNPLAGAKSGAGATRGTRQVVAARHPPRSTEAAYPLAGSSAGLGSPRDQRRLGRNLPPYLGCIPKQPDFADKRLARCGGVRAQRGFHPLWPHSMGLAPGPSLKGASAELQFERRKPLDSHLGLFRLARPLLGESLPPVRGGNCRRGSLLSGAPDHDRARGARGGRSHPLVVRSALGAKSVFSQPRRGARATNLLRPRRPDPPPAVGQQNAGWGGEHASAWRPGRSGAKATRAWDRRASSFAAQIAPSGCLFVCWRPGPSRAAGAEARRRRSRAAARGFDGRSAPGSARRPRGIVCSFVKLGVALRFRGIDNDPSAGSVDFHSVIGGRTAKRRPRSNTSPDHSIGRAAVCTKGGGVVSELMTCAY